MEIMYFAFDTYFVASLFSSIVTPSLSRYLAAGTLTISSSRRPTFLISPTNQRAAAPSIRRRVAKFHKRVLARYVKEIYVCKLKAERDGNDKPSLSSVIEESELPNLDISEWPSPPSAASLVAVAINNIADADSTTTLPPPPPPWNKQPIITTTTTKQ